jgi:DNA polymerase-3 subunit delta
VDYNTAANRIRSGEISPLYLIFGDEPVFIGDVVWALKSRLIPDEALESILYFAYDTEADDPDKGAGEMRSGTFFGMRKLCLVKSPDLKDMNQGWRTALAAYAGNHNPSAVVALVVSVEPPQSDPVRRAFEDHGTVVQCARLRGKDAGKWAVAYISSLGKKISPSAAWALESISGPSLGVLKNEVEKLVLYTGARDTIQAADVALVCSDAVEVRVFGLVDAIVAGRAAQASAALDKLLSQGEIPQRLFAFIAQNMRNIARAHYLRQSGTPDNQIGRALAVHPFVAMKASAAASKLTGVAVESMYEVMVSADEAQKSGCDAILTLQTMVLELASLFPAGR